MHEALRALCGFMFGELGFERIEADVDPRNLASIKVLQRLGFEEEGYLRERWRVRGEVQDSMIFGLLKRDGRGSDSAYHLVVSPERRGRIGFKPGWWKPLIAAVGRSRRSHTAIKI
jgi:hypothetical protein